MNHLSLCVLVCERFFSCCLRSFSQLDGKTIYYSFILYSIFLLAWLSFHYDHQNGERSCSIVRRCAIQLPKFKCGWRRKQKENNDKKKRPIDRQLSSILDLDLNLNDEKTIRHRVDGFFSTLTLLPDKNDDIRKRKRNNRNHNS